MKKRRKRKSFRSITRPRFRKLLIELMTKILYWTMMRSRNSAVIGRKMRMATGVRMRGDLMTGPAPDHPPGLQDGGGLTAETRVRTSNRGGGKASRQGSVGKLLTGVTL